MLKLQTQFTRAISFYLNFTINSRKRIFVSTWRVYSTNKKIPSFHDEYIRRKRLRGWPRVLFHSWKWHCTCLSILNCSFVVDQFLPLHLILRYQWSWPSSSSSILFSVGRPARSPRDHPLYLPVESLNSFERSGRRSSATIVNEYWSIDRCDTV